MTKEKKAPHLDLAMGRRACNFLFCLRSYQAGLRVQLQLWRFVAAAEIEHAEQSACFYVGRAVTDPSQVPVVFNKAKNRRLVCGGVIHEVLPGVRRDDQQRSTRTVSATSLSGRSGIGSASPGSGQEVIASRLRLVDDGIHHVVVPAIGVIVGDDDGRAL